MKCPYSGFKRDRYAVVNQARSALEVMVPVSPDPKKNQLLAALPEAEWQRWLPQLELVEMLLGQDGV